MAENLLSVFRRVGGVEVKDDGLFFSFEMQPDMLNRLPGKLDIFGIFHFPGSQA